MVRHAATGGDDLRFHPFGSIARDKPTDCIQVLRGLRCELKRRIHPCSFSCDGIAVFDHPVFEVKLLPDDFERLIEDLAGILIRARPDGQIDDALLFGLPFNRHRESLSKS